ncbi:hypothetical protein HRbin16_01491 [bacterium HR16]|nr:hypothetical protein HRbin16_01491 [bacterium HR16]
MRHRFSKLLVSVSLIVCLMGVGILIAQQLWTWNQQCPSNEWFATCQGDVCASNPTRYWYYNNWGRVVCGSSSDLTFPEPGSEVIFPSGADARLASDVDVKSIFVAPNATFTWQSGTILLRDPANNDAPGVFTNQGSVVTVSGYNRTLRGLLVNDGEFEHPGATIFLSDATLRNLAGRTLLLSGGSFFMESGSALLQNLGTLRKVNDNFSEIGVPFEDSGTVLVEQGTLQISNTSTHTNVSWSVASGATLYFPSGATHTFVGNHSGAVQGSLVSDTVLRSGGSQEVVFNFTGNGLTWREGVIDGGSAGIRNTGSIVTVSGYNRTLRGLLVNDGEFEHPGATIFLSDATLRNLAGRTLLLSGGSFFMESGSALLQNLGTLRKVSDDFSAIGVPLQNAGLIDLQEGSLAITSSFTQTDGETRIRSGRTLSLSIPMELQGGKLTGAGMLSGNINHTGGAIAPGVDDPNNPDLNPLGILTFDGDLTMGQDAILEIELAGTDNSDPNNPQYDQVIIGVSGYSRTVQLDGTLRLKGRDGYTPSVGDAFDILVLTASSWDRTGVFTQVEVDETTLPGVQAEVEYLPDRVRVRLVNTFAIRGKIELRDFAGDVTQVPIAVELRQNGSSVRTETVFTDAEGNYVLPDVITGTYDVAFKASHWLRVVVYGVTVSGDVTGVDVSLTNGDIDGDNEVTLFDFGELVQAFGSVPGDTNWNPNADLDGDEEVTLFDFGVLVRNFGAIGDE